MKNIEELTCIANHFLKTTYHLELSIPIRISNRMSAKLGAFVLKGNKPYEIVLSINLIENYNLDTIVDVLKHECVHYALYSLGRPFKDGQTDFESELKRLNISSTYTYSFKGTVHVYKCNTCNIVFHKRIKGYEKRYRCGRCRKKFKYLGEKILK